MADYLESDAEDFVSEATGKCCECGRVGPVRHPGAAPQPGDVVRCLHRTCYDDGRYTKRRVYYCAGISLCAAQHRETLHPVLCAGGYTIEGNTGCTKPVWNQWLAGAGAEEHPDWQEGRYCFQHLREHKEREALADRKWRENQRRYVRELAPAGV